MPFFAVLLLLWTLWFVRWRDRWLLMSIVGAGLCLAIALLPFAIAYSRVHQIYGMSRSFEEVLAFSADVTSLVTATHISALWGWTSGLNGGESQLFPGLVLTVLVAIGAIVAVGERRVPRDRGDWMARVLAAIAVAYLVVALCAKYAGPWRAHLGPLTIGADVIFKPMSVAVAAAVLAVAASSRARDGWTRRSPLAFYLVATVVLFVCSFGPKPTFLGEQVLYAAAVRVADALPPFSDEIRAPARFAMLAVLTLSAAGALAFDRLRLDASRRRLAAAVLMIGIAAEGWIRGFPTPSLPDLLPAGRVAGFEAVLELPLGDQDESAMYRATAHGRPIVNGYSGYVPPDYAAMAGAVREQDDSVLDAIAGTGHLVIAVDGRTDPNHFWRTTLGARAGATHLGDDGDWSLFTVTPAPSAPICQARELPVVRVFDDRGVVDVSALTDRNPDTFWRRPEQRAADGFVLDLGQAVSPCGLSMSLGHAAWAFPRKLGIATSEDGTGWTTVFEGSTSAEAVRGAIARPTDAWLEFPLPATTMRFIRIQIDVSRPAVPWQISDVVVRGSVLTAP